MTEPTREVYSVSLLTGQVRRLLEGSFPAVWVRGEIQGYSVHGQTQTVYLTLKDAQASLKAVFFRGRQLCESMELQDGVEVEAYGSLTVYEKQGSYQLRILRIERVGQGTLYQQYQELRKRLFAEGLFDPARKRPIPKLPSIIGVVTSPDGAAIRDFLKTLRTHHAGTHVRIFPTLVQGTEAAGQIARAIQYASAYRLCDVLVVTRGGGSIEDLWPFNEEVVARAIAASEIPVISAVGHERDFTIADEVADLRCATPTAAANCVIAEKRRLLELLANFLGRLTNGLRLRLLDAQRRTELALRSPALCRPLERIQAQIQYLDSLTQRLGAALPHLPVQSRYRLDSALARLENLLPQLAERRRAQLQMLLARWDGIGARLLPERQARVENALGQLRMLGPENVLQRGYAILRKKDGRIVREVGDVLPGEVLTGFLRKGKIPLRVH